MTDNNLHSDDYIALPSLKKILFSSAVMYFKVSGFFKHIFNVKKVTLLTGLVIGMILGYTYFLFHKPYYKASMLVQSNTLTKRAYSDIIERLNALITNGTQNSLAEELKVQTDISNSLVFIHAQNINNEPLAEDTSSLKEQPFKIIVGFKNEKFLNAIQNTVLDYLNNRPYLKTLYQENNKLNIEKMQFTDSQLQKLDSLETQFNSFLASSKVSATIYNNAINPAEIYRQSNTLIYQKEQTQRLLNIDNKPILLIDGLKILSRPNPYLSFIKYVLSGGLIIFFITFLIAFYLESKKKIISISMRQTPVA